MTSRNKGDFVLLSMLLVAALIWLAIGLRETFNDKDSFTSLVLVGHIAFGMQAYDSRKLGKFFALMLMALMLAVVKFIVL